jgi:hypothetical protein
MNLGQTRHALAVRAFLLALGLSGCGRPFAVTTPPSMIELEQQTDYAYRAMTPDGVVLGVRVADSGKTDAAFWSQAVTLHMKELSGYAFLATADVATADGVPGKELRFGHDESNRPYQYVVRLFVLGQRLFVVEAGGTKEEMDRARPAVDRAMGSIRLR